MVRTIGENRCRERVGLDQQGDRQVRATAYRAAAVSYETAASADQNYWSDWCYAALEWSVAPGNPDPSDLILADGRKCISGGIGQSESEKPLGLAHRCIAEVLVTRNVFDDALNEAREASELLPSDPFSFAVLADAFYGLRRFDETVTASKRAIALSDGKVSSTHFRLGSAYFELKDWEEARQSFEKAAQLDSSDTAAPYNVALCLVHLGYYRDAITWYREVLRRDPKYSDRDQILERITYLESNSH